MSQRICICCATIVLFFNSGYASAGEQPEGVTLKQLLQSQVQRSIETAEDSLVSILVSKSKNYQKFGYPDLQPWTGRLGGFERDRVDNSLQVSGLAPKMRQALLQQMDLANLRTRPDSFGTGVIWNDKGQILTNFHVVKGATKILLRFSKRRFCYANILAGDPRSDLAILEPISKMESLQPIQFAKDSIPPRGTFVVSLAFQIRSVSPSASFGIISNIHEVLPFRVDQEIEHSLYKHGPIIETDARLQAGCSGGALLNLNGEIIGLTTSLAAIQGVDVPGGFAIPLHKGIRSIIDKLTSGLEVEYGFLGVGFEQSLQTTNGISISYVTPGSAADKNGIQSRDVLLSLDGRRINHSDELLQQLGTLMAGTQIKLEILSSETKIRRFVGIVLDKFYLPAKSIAALTQRPIIRGLKVDYTSILVQDHPLGLGTKRIPKGVVITEVEPNTPAATSLLKPGEVITHVNQKAVTTPDEFYQILRANNSAVELTLHPNGLQQPPPKVVLEK